MIGKEENILRKYLSNDQIIVLMQNDILHLVAMAMGAYKNEDKLVENLSLSCVRNSADSDYWSERCKHAENIIETNPCAPDITEEQIEAHSKYHKFIKDNGSKYYL